MSSKYAALCKERSSSAFSDAHGFFIEAAMAKAPSLSQRPKKHFSSTTWPNNPVNRTAEHLPLGCLYLPRAASGYFHR